MPRVLVVGYGNPLRRDDALGWHAVRELKRRTEPAEIQCLPTRQLTPELADRMRHADRVIFIDASAEAELGRVDVQRVEAIPGRPSFSHRYTPAGLLALCQTLYSACPECYLVSVGAANFGHGEELTSLVEESLPEVVDQVLRLAAREG